MKEILSRLLLKYFRILAKLQLKKNNPIIIGITGSAGKTSTLNAIESAISPHIQTKVSYKANSESGIPLNILGLKVQEYSMLEWLYLAAAAPIKLLTNWEKYQVYAAEMAIDSPWPPKNMGYLLTIISPQIGIFLNAKPMHSEPFDELVREEDPKKRAKAITHAIALEKGKLITSLPAHGTAVLNADDEEVRAFASKTSASVLTIGKNKSAAISFYPEETSLDNGSTFIFEYEGNSYKLQFKQYLLPEHFGYTFSAALSAAVSLDIPIEAAVSSLESSFSLPRGRSSLIKAVNGAYILDSSYNASADPTIDSLELLDASAPGKKLAILGDIRELGKESEYEHLRVADKAGNTCDVIALVGPEMKKYALPILQENKDITAEWFENAAKAAAFIKGHLEKDSLLLVKGSQNTLLLEAAVEKLMKHPEKANSLLCRRGSFWDKKRQLLS